MRRFRKSSYTAHERYKNQHRFEHWYRDKTVYFITARCRDRYPAFASEDAKQVFWDRFNYYVTLHRFTPFVTSLIDNHYHTLGYLERAEDLGPMMRKIHGSVAKLVNDLLPARRLPFWRGKGNQDYYDGCIRDELQYRRAYRYTLRQSVRHGIAPNYDDYPHTVINVELERALKRALEVHAFLEDVGYPRYDRKRRKT
jgi:hypothetical protein